MDKRALWSRILVIIGLLFIILTYWYGDFEILGVIAATLGAILSKSPRRKILLWGAGIVGVAVVGMFIFAIILGITGTTEITTMEFAQAIPKFLGIPLVLGVIIIAIGAMAILTDKKRPVSPPMSSGTGEDLTGATPADAGSLHSAAEIKRIGRKKGLVWGAVLVAVPLLVIGIFLLTRGGEKTDGPQMLYAEGQYFTVGSTREEVLKIQGPPTFKLEIDLPPNIVPALE
ncbi:MAG: hypothetical protein MUQ25_08350 [Candidatus Aminicenantes bacterium]|nr:hypothetical protein [Candidatus Aminicenantes bacterium]